MQEGTFRARQVGRAHRWLHSELENAAVAVLHRQGATDRQLWLTGRSTGGSRVSVSDSSMPAFMLTLCANTALASGRRTLP